MHGEPDEAPEKYTSHDEDIFKVSMNMSLYRR